MDDSWHSTCTMCKEGKCERGVNGGINYKISDSLPSLTDLNYLEMFSFCGINIRPRSIIGAFRI